MATNSDHYKANIDMDEQPRDVLMGLVHNNFEPFLTYWNRQGSDKVEVTLDALSNLFGVDFELYSTDTGFIPFYI